MEKWKVIEGFETYEVSNIGRVRNIKTSRIKRTGTVKGGYLNVCLRTGRKGDPVKTLSVHRLTAKAFIPNPENKPTVNHKDFNTKNNDIRNLEWFTHKEQTAHKFDNGRVSKENYRKFKAAGIEAISIKVRCVETGIEYSSMTDAANAVGLKSNTSISNVFNGIQETAGRGADGKRLHWELV